MLDDPKILQSLGSSILKEAIARAAINKVNAGKFGKAADDDYLEMIVGYEDSINGYCDCWAEDIEHQFEHNPAEKQINQLKKISKAELEKHFSADEIKLLNQHQLIRG